MTDYLLEIGSEELPYSFIPSAMEQLKNIFSCFLTEARISYSEVKTYGTPRRLSVIVKNIGLSQPDIVKTVKGPPAKISYTDNGEFTQAALGFAKKNNIDPAKFYKDSVAGVEYLFADIEEKGKNTGEVLEKVLPELILKLQGSHFMRWGDYEVKFSRPIRWIVSFLGDEEVKIRIADVESSRYSRGHRFSQDSKVLINSVDSYFDDLRKANVIVDQAIREKLIINSAQEAAKSINGTVKINPELLKEVTYLVEYPTPVIGNFEKKYLVIPKEVIITVMASHQRYFPVFDAKGNLLNSFITISNAVKPSALENITRGNERVIRARLDDAIFFYTEDTDRRLESRVEDLKGVTFQKGLGTLFDKMNRIREISLIISEKFDAETTNKIERTALLCKADLVSSLVREFTELQGVIGSEYATLENEHPDVAQGIKEHYYPLSSDAEIADSLTGQVVGIADKIDTIAGVFALGKSPTGSADPLGLRRAALGILLTLINKDINLNLTELISSALSVQPVKIEYKDLLLKEISEFIIQRLRGYLTDTFRYDVVEAVFCAGDPLADLKDTMLKIKALSELVMRKNYNLFHEAANRVHRIIKQEQYNPVPNPDLFVVDIERQLWDCTKDLDVTKLNYQELISKLEGIIPYIEKFFEEVLVMDPDMDIRTNRLSLLANLRSKFLKIADFSKIVS